LIWSEANTASRAARGTNIVCKQRAAGAGKQTRARARWARHRIRRESPQPTVGLPQQLDATGADSYSWTRQHPRAFVARELQGVYAGMATVL